MKRGMVLLAMALVMGSCVGLAQGEVSPLGIVPEPPPGLTVSIWPGRPQYVIGETAQIYFYVSQPAYVYIFDFEPTGYVRQIFPNAYSPNPYVGAGTHVLPDRPTYRLRVTPPPGTESLQIIASTMPLGFGVGTEADPYPLLGPTPEEGRARILGIVPEPRCGCYATAWTTIQILPSPTPSYQPPPCPPCWGWQPCPPCWVPPGYPAYGWGWYYLDEGWHIFIGECPDEARWCWYLGPDGRWHVQFRIRIGAP